MENTAPKKQKNLRDRVWNFLNKPLVVAIIAGLLSLAGSILYTKKNINDLKIGLQQGQNQSQTNITSPILGQKVEDPCSPLIPLDSNAAELSYDRIQKSDEYYIPTGAGNTIEGIVWVRRTIRSNFKKIFIEYEVLTESEDKPPSLIWILARKSENKERQTMAKIWAPEYSETDNIKTPQLVGFAQTVDYTKNNLDRETSEELPDPVKRDRLDSLTIEPTSVNGSEMSTNFTYNFTSDRNNIAAPHTFTRKLIFPFSNLSNSGELLDLGIGTYIGNKFRIVSLNICY